MGRKPSQKSVLKKLFKEFEKEFYQEGKEFVCAKLDCDKCVVYKECEDIVDALERARFKLR